LLTYFRHQIPQARISGSHSPGSSSGDDRVADGKRTHPEIGSGSTKSAIAGGPGDILQGVSDLHSQSHRRAQE